MTCVRRIRAVGAVLALAAVLTNAHVWGKPSDQTSREQFRASTGQLTPEKGPRTLAEDLAIAKFAQGGALTYQTTGGQTLFALQVQPKLTAGPALPRDLLFLVDTSASQVQGPLNQAVALTEQVIAEANAADRIAVWTVNTPAATRNLTRGFQAARSEAVQEAVKALQKELPLGDTDLKGGLSQALETFERTTGRQQVLVYLGDGMSLHNPITPADRTRLCEEMVQREITLFSIPLGPRLDPDNLHRLATSSGGTVVRLVPREPIPAAVKRLQEALATPVLYAKSFQLSNVVTGAFPTKLPPLRADAPTLLVGRIQPGSKTLAYTLEGTVAGRQTRLEQTETVPDAEADNFFLVGMVEQWKAGGKDQPALLRGDRVLAHTYEQAQLARAELLTQAETALTQDKLEAAQSLFEQARQLDPQDVEADAGLKVVKKLREGGLKKEQLRSQIAQPTDLVLRIDKAAGPKNVKLTRDQVIHLAQAEQKLPAAPEKTPSAEPEDLLRAQKQRLAIEEQRVNRIVEDAEQQARRLLPTDPDAAHDLLKRVHASVRDNPDLSERTRLGLLNRLEAGLRNVDTRGALIKRDLEERQRRQAEAQSRLAATEAQTAAEERVRRRMLQFQNLMAQARFEDATIVALNVQQDAIATGAPVPPAATAGYYVGLAAHNLQEVQELVRIRQERFLATLLQVEKSHVPFPDEPPVQFPPAAVWRELTRNRKGKYESTALMEDDPATQARIQELKRKMSASVSLPQGIDAQPLRDVLDFLTTRYDLTILVDTQAFKSPEVGIDAIEDQAVKLPRLSGVSLGTVFRLLLSQFNGTFLIRRDYVEITTAQRAIAEKVIQAYPVADLVIPIPNAFNQQQVLQTLTIFGGAGAVGGLAQGGALGLGGAVGFGGGLGALGGGLGALGGGLGALGLGGGLGALGVGGLGALGGGLGALGGGLGALGLGGGGLGALGVAGGGLAGLGGGFGGGLGFAGGQVNLGVGGGAAGFGGGQLGQLGNLGGQFGLQGGDQSSILLQTIQEVVARGEWARLPAFNRPLGNLVRGGAQDDEQDERVLELNLLNSLGYYPPSRALIVRATSRIHTRLGGGLLNPRPAGAPPANVGAADNKRDGVLVFAPRKNDPLNKLNAAATAARSEDKKPARDLKKDLKDNRPALAELDPKTIWQEALAKGVSDPGLIIAVADFLAECQKFDHVAEFLKANLRLGIVIRPWVYEALAVALEASGGSPEEIERARVSAVDLEPQDASSFVRASKAMAEQKRYDRAVAFCRQAALLEPNVSASYAEVLKLAELAKDSEAMAWAAGNLLRRDWPEENDQLHRDAQGRLSALARSLEKDNRKAEVERMLATANRLRQRDLEIRLSWQGDADLDLEVVEPIGTRCSFLQRQTPAGGLLLGDTAAPNGQEAYVAAKAFSGDYQVTVRRVWGRPLGGKATVEVIRQKGTPREKVERQTILLDRSQTLTVTLADGRRTAPEQVPPLDTRRLAQSPAEAGGPDRIFNKLRAMADPERTGTESGMRGGLTAFGSPSDKKAVPKPVEMDRGRMVAYQNAVTPFLANSIDLTARAEVNEDADRRYLRLSLAPVFSNVNKGPAAPTVRNPLIPGGVALEGSD